MKADRNNPTLREKLRCLWRAMRSGRGGYAMVTVLVICSIVVGMLILATLIIVEKSYVAQEKLFDSQVELLQRQGNIEAAHAEIEAFRAAVEAWPTEAVPLTLTELDSRLTGIAPLGDEPDPYQGKSQGIYRGIITLGTDPDSGKPTRTFTLTELFGDPGEAGESKEWIAVTVTVKLTLTVNAANEIEDLGFSCETSMEDSVFTQSF